MNVKAVIPAPEAQVGLVEVIEVDLIGAEAAMEAVEAKAMATAVGAVCDLNVEAAIEDLEILEAMTTRIG